MVGRRRTSRTVREPGIVANVLEIYPRGKLFKPPDFIHVPVDNTQPVFNLKQISETQVINIINAMKNSKAKDIYNLDSNLFKTYK